MKLIVSNEFSELPLNTTVLTASIVRKGSDQWSPYFSISSPLSFPYQEEDAVSAVARANFSEWGIYDIENLGDRLIFFDQPGYDCIQTADSKGEDLPLYVIIFFSLIVFVCVVLCGFWLWRRVRHCPCLLPHSSLTDLLDHSSSPLSSSSTLTSPPEDLELTDIPR